MLTWETHVARQKIALIEQLSDQELLNELERRRISRN